MNTTADHPNRVHEFLLDASAYTHCPQHVELKETHISWVYLTDRYVYKQKKPVSFEFLDFSSLERRKHYCEQELMLNQRFSPDVYLGVVPVSTDATGNYQLKPGKKIVEWLVMMKRLDENSTLENLIRHDQLTAGHTKKLADTLSSFFTRQAPAMVRSDEFLTRLRNHVLANRNDLLIALPRTEHAVTFATNAQLRCLSLEADYFVQRVADGRVVDGHGDLRPEHIYFDRNKPKVIDCIEFSAEYRTNDVVDELAFLAMECDRLGNDSVGNEILNSYLTAGRDEPRSFLSQFYKCYRACVRAKVAALRAAQPAKQKATDSLELGQAYINLAEKYAIELGNKVVVLVGGLSGTGKSTLASAIQAPLAAEVLQTDVIRKDLYSMSPTNGKYTPEGKTRVYDAMVEQMGFALSHSPTLILDGTFSSKANRQAVVDKAMELGAMVLQVQCECPTAEAKNRIASRIARGNGNSDATPAVHDTQAAEYEDPLDADRTVRINTTQPLPEQIKEVLDTVRQVTHASPSASR